MNQLSISDIELLGGIETITNCFDHNYTDDFDPCLYIELETLDTYEKRKQFQDNYKQKGMRRTGSISMKIPDLITLASFEGELRVIHAANYIKKCFGNAITNPKMTMCKNRLNREYNDLQF